MANQPTEINRWDWPESTLVPRTDDYGLRQAPDVSTTNLEFLAEKYNELLRYVLSSGSTPNQE